MATKLKEGEAVQVVDRPATPSDEKAQIFFNHYRNVTGTLEKVYDDGRATILVEVESLPDEIRERHAELTNTARQKWLDGLSAEARGKLTPDEQIFKMRYTILVETEDLIKKGAKQPPLPEPTAQTKAAKSATLKAAAPGAITSTDLDKAEEEYLKARQAKEGK